MNIALYIDGDNVSSEYCETILSEAAKLGDIRIKSVFGRCDTFSGKGWKDAAHDHGIKTCPQVNNLRGKSAADIALVIEVMRQLERDTCGGIVIASNDTDYTALLYEIKSRGLKAWCLITKATDNVYVKSADAVRILQKSQSKPPPEPKPQVVKIAPAEKFRTKAAQPKKGTFRQIAVVLKKAKCRNEKSIRNKIKSDYLKTTKEIDAIVKNMRLHRLVTFDANGHATWSTQA